jgi:DHA1 family tetracycline resistance protein-like MFS transporter
LPADGEKPEEREQPLGFGIQAAVYAVAFFTANVLPMFTVVLPLWVLDLGFSPLLIGIVVSSRQLLVILFSIHAGALLHLFGMRRVIVISLVVCAISTAVYPVFPVAPVVILLQIISGYAESTSWIGAQMLVGRYLGGRTVYVGRMSSAGRVGGFIGPLLTGFAWDHGGAWGAYLTITAWTVAGLVAALVLPRLPEDSAKARLGEALPKLSDYFDTFRLMVVPAVALVMLVTFMRQAGIGMNGSFYGVWLNGEGISGSTIGLLLGLGAAASAFGTLFLAPLTRLVSDYMLMVWSTVFAILAVAITPLLGSNFQLLLLAMIVAGVGNGFNFSLMLTIGTRSVEEHQQGMALGLRLMINRIGGAAVPLFMGFLAEMIGLEDSFYWIGGVGAAILAVCGIWAMRSSVFSDRRRG